MNEVEFLSAVAKELGTGSDTTDCLECRPEFRERLLAALRKRLQQAERERALELSALRAVAEWCKEHTADLGILLYEDQFRVVELRLSGVQTLTWKGRPLVEDSMIALADALGLEWREP